MKLQLNKLMAGLVLAGSAMALVGCGGGEAPTLVINQNVALPAIKGDQPATVEAARTIFTAATGAKFTLPELTFTGVGNPDKDVPADSVLQVTAKANPVGKEIGSFKLTNGADSAQGTIEAGSCVFKVASDPAPTGIFAGMGGKTYEQADCQIKLDVKDVAVGSTGSAVVTLVLNDNTIVSDKEIKIEVTEPAGTDNTVTIKVGGVEVAVKVPTGGTP